MRMKLTDKIRVVDQVLIELKSSPIHENSIFSYDEMSTDDWVKVDLVIEAANWMPLSLTFSQLGIGLRLDRIAEAIDWSNQNLLDDGEIVTMMIKNIFTSYILVTYRGQSHTSMRLFSENGKQLHNFEYREGYSFNNKSEYKLYTPIFRE